QLLHSRILDRRTGVPDQVEGEQEPVLIVEEAGIDDFLHERVLTGELGADVGDLDVLARLVLPLEGDLVLLRLPDPGAVQPQLRPSVEGERVADRVPLGERAESIGLCDLVGNRWALLCRYRRGENQHTDRHQADQRNATRLRHGHPPWWVTDSRVP